MANEDYFDFVNDKECSIGSHEGLAMEASLQFREAVEIQPIMALTRLQHYNLHVIQGGSSYFDYSV